MTRRERMQRRLEQRETWANSARSESTRRFDAAHTIAAQIPLGQPILVGHHSERHARRDADRITTNMTRGCEAASRAEHHASKAAGIEAQLEHSVFSDDPDAIERIRERITENTAKADKYAAINRAWRKSKGDLAALVATGLVGEKLAQTIAETMKICPWLRTPLDTTSLRQRIRADQQRIEDIRRRQARTAQAQAAGGLVVDIHTNCDWATVTFAEKPDRRVLDALRAAGFCWRGGSWAGHASRLPDELNPNRTACPLDRNTP